jgi:hypothetical protein
MLECFQYATTYFEIHRDIGMMLLMVNLDKLFKVCLFTLNDYNQHYIDDLGSPDAPIRTGISLPDGAFLF